MSTIIKSLMKSKDKFIKRDIELFTSIEANAIKISDVEIIEEKIIIPKTLNSNAFDVNVGSSPIDISSYRADEFVNIVFEYLKKAEGFVTTPYPDENGVSLGVGLLVISNYITKYKQKYKRIPTYPLRKDAHYRESAKKDGISAFIDKYRSAYTTDEINRIRNTQQVPKDLYLKVGLNVVAKFINEIKAYFTDFDLLPLSTKMLLVDQGYAAGTGYLGWNPPAASKGVSIRSAAQNIINIIKRQGDINPTEELRQAYLALLNTWTKYKIFYKYFHLGARRQQTVWHLLHWTHLNTVGKEASKIVDEYRISISKKDTYNKYIEGYKFVIQNNLLPPAYFNLKGANYSAVRQQKIEFDRRKNRPDISEVVALLN